MTDDQLRELGKQLPFERPEPARRDAVRSSLLIAAAEQTAPAAPRRRWLAVGAAFASGALAAAAVALVLVRGADDEATVSEPRASVAQITASTEARLEHRVATTTTGGVDETIHLRDGQVQLSVAEARPGDRVRLTTRDAEVEGSGVYEVRVVDDVLESVRVRSGTAEIRVVGQRAVMLSSGQTWRAAIITADLTPDAGAAAEPAPADPAPAPAPAPAPSDNPPAPAADPVTAPAEPPRVTAVVPRPQPAPPRAPRTDEANAIADAMTGSATPPPAQPPVAPAITIEPPPAPPPPAKRVTTDLERRFQAGWALLRQGKAREAAAELGAAADASPADPLAADARYFQAIALVRAGERAEAERVLVRFLDAAPKSLRRGRAAVLLGRLVGERGDVASARAWLESAVTDPDPAVATSARAGLEALPPRR